MYKILFQVLNDWCRLALCVIWSISDCRFIQNMASVNPTCLYCAIIFTHTLMHFHPSTCKFMHTCTLSIFNHQVTDFRLSVDHPGLKTIPTISRGGLGSKAPRLSGPVTSGRATKLTPDEKKEGEWSSWQPALTQATGHSLRPQPQVSWCRCSCGLTQLPRTH